MREPTVLEPHDPHALLNPRVRVDKTFLCQHLPIRLGERHAQHHVPFSSPL